ncbi:MAG: ExbD/TolR family protein [Nitrospinota bacterium]
MKFGSQLEEDYSLQLTPLIDVVFLLLIFFMVSTSFIDFSKQLDIELPEAISGAALEKVKLFEIEINKDKKLFLNGETITLDGLSTLLKKSDPTIQKQSALISADKNLDYGAVIKIIGICKDANIEDIGLVVK